MDFNTAFQRLDNDIARLKLARLEHLHIQESLSRVAQAHAELVEAANNRIALLDGELTETRANFDKYTKRTDVGQIIEERIKNGDVVTDDEFIETYGGA